MREARRLEKYEKSPLGFAEKQLNKFKSIAEEHVISKLPTLDQIMKDPTVGKVFNAVSDPDFEKNLFDKFNDIKSMGDTINKGVKDLTEKF